MESELLQLIIVFVVGLVCGALIMLLWNKLTSGSASAAGLKQEYQDYQEKVETHFEQTSKKFEDMTEQYQDLYKHLSLGAASLCRPDSVAATLADESDIQLKIENKEQPVVEPEVVSSSVADNKVTDDKQATTKDCLASGQVEGESDAKVKSSADESEATIAESDRSDKKKDSSA
jgi:uncharacterized membrane-anchored protein YhcB (DUF1043 family)